jgi:diguanylate cyclase (GGDEF)-like protein/PAS domain S-box-containing protein
MNAVADLLHRIRGWLPTGVSLPEDVWNSRHRGILVVLWLHVVGVPLYGLLRGFSLVHVTLEGSVIAALALSASGRRRSRELRMLAATLGLVTSSALLVHLSGGLVEMHFHFFVVVAIITLYQSWVPFLLAIGFVLVHHGVMGVLDPSSVSTNPDAAIHPWKWAAIHASFIMAESAACLTFWRSNEVANARRESSEATARARGDELVRSDDRFRSLLQNSSDAVLLLTGGLMIAYSSESTERVLGRPGESLLGQPFLELVHPEERAKVASWLAGAAGEAGSISTMEHRLLRDGDHWSTCETLVANRLQNPSVGALVLTIRDVSERRQLEDQLRNLAFHDPLTGLGNRALFQDNVHHALQVARRTGSSCSVLFIDLDNFKTVNDSLGHSAGDALLKVIARRIEGALRAGDRVARLGGDEFAVLVEDVGGTAAALHLGQRLLEALQFPERIAGKAIVPQASIGIATVAGGQTTVDALLRDADVAMYEAKSRGKGCCESFRPAMHTNATRRLQLEEDLRGAIARGEFVVHYQPIVRLTDGSLAGVEALVRWRHPERGLLPPSEFIHLAEETGLIEPIGRWVLTEACRQVAELQRGGGVKDLRLNVNLSSRQLAGRALGDDVARALQGSGLPPSSLVLEITETVLMQDSEEIIGRMAGLRDLGCQFAMDDFGTGYSSLAYLRRFPIQIVKIDRSFVASLGEAAEDTAVVRAILSLAQTFGMEVVAEGIEHQWQAEQLARLGCERGQGYYFGRAMDLENLCALLARQATETLTLDDAPELQGAA